MQLPARHKLNLANRWAAEEEAQGAKAATPWLEACSTNKFFLVKHDTFIGPYALSIAQLRSRSLHNKWICKKRLKLAFPCQSWRFEGSRELMITHQTNSQ